MNHAADKECIETLFGTARSHNGWLDDSVSLEDLRKAFGIAKWGPTSMNSQPLRILFLHSTAAKERLRPALAVTNVAKALAAPVVAVFAYDMEFHAHLPRTFPHNPAAQNYFESNRALVEPTAFRNSSLQAAYFMLALRAVGLDVGPMSGFDAAKVNAEFFDDNSWRVNFICAIGHGDTGKLFPRLPRLEFEEATRVL